MAATGLKSVSRTLSDFADPGTNNFTSATLQSTGASSRTAIGDGDGVYKGFFDCTNVSKIAYINGSGSLSDPTSNSIYAIYEPDYTNGRETTGNESIYDILKRIGDALRTDTYLSQSEHKNTLGDTAVLAVSPGMTEMVTGTSGYSAKLTQSSTNHIHGQGTVGHADYFCVLGENSDSDHDTQALCFYDGTLESGNGKSDSWRGSSPKHSSWSYWGEDFHSDSSNQNIVNSKQTNIGLVSNTNYSGVLYILAYGEM